MALFDITIPTDDLVVLDEILTGEIYLPSVSDSVDVSESLSIQSRMRVKKVTPISPTKIKIEFVSGAIVNDDLVNPSNYIFSEVSPGAANVVPVSVEIPFGVSSPSYVYIETSEHTDNAEYELTIGNNIIGNNVLGGDYSFNYIGIGESPTVILVLAVAQDEVDVYFSENMKDNTSIRDANNYVWDGGLQTLSVLSVIDNVVTLKTSAQTESVLYNLTIRGVSSIKTSDVVGVSDQISASLL